MRILLVARYTLLEAVRRRLLIAIVVLSVAYLGLFTLGFALLHGELFKKAGTDIADNGLPMFSALMTLMGFYALSFLASLMALFASAGAISGEVESGVLHAVLAKPIRRRDIVLGKWLGQAILITGYVWFMTGGMVLGSEIASGYSPPDPILAAVYMTWSAVILLSLGTFGGAFLPTLTNGVAVFLLFGLSRIASFIESLGGMVKSDGMINLGIGVSLVIPCDAMWQAASYYLQPQLMIVALSQTPGTSLPFASSTPPTTPMLIWSAAYVVVAVIAAILVFNRRDL